MSPTKGNGFYEENAAQRSIPTYNKQEALVFCATVGTNFAFLKSEGNHMHKVYTLRTCFLIHAWLYS